MKDSETNWHLSKGLTISVIIGIFLQVISLVGVYWKMDNRITNLEKWQVETSSNRFTVSDAELLKYRVSNNEENWNILDEKMDLVISKLSKIEYRLGEDGVAFISKKDT